VTSFDRDGIGLTFVFCDGGVDAVYDVGTDGSFEDGREGDGGAIGGCGSRGEDVDLRTSCLHKIELAKNQGKKIHQSIHHQLLNKRATHTVHLIDDEIH